MGSEGFIESITMALAAGGAAGSPYVSEEELAGRVEVSRTRLRESLQVMDAYGMIEKRQRLGVKLKKTDRGDLKETYDLRALLEAHAMASVLEHISMRDIRELEELSGQVARAERAGDQAGAQAGDLKFHYTLITIARLPLLERLLRQLRLLEYSFLIDDLEWNPAEVNPWSHELLIEKLKTRSPECIEVVRRHIEWAGASYLEALGRKE